MIGRKELSRKGSSRSLAMLVTLGLAGAPEAWAEEVLANDLAPLQDLSAMVLGVSAGALGGLVVGTLLCPVFHAGNSSELWACAELSSPVIFLTGGIGGIFGGIHGYQNSQFFVMAGGVVAGGIVGAPFGSAFTLTAMGGGVLGYMLWSARDAREAQVSLLPYWDQENSGFVLSGRF